MNQKKRLKIALRLLIIGGIMFNIIPLFLFVLPGTAHFNLIKTFFILGGIPLAIGLALLFYTLESHKVIIKLTKELTK